MDDSLWYYAIGGERQGPVGFEHLRQLMLTGQIAPTDLVWRQGMADWQAAHTIAGLGAPPPPPRSPIGPPQMSSPPPPPAGYGYYGVAPMGYASARPIGASYNGMAIAGFVLSLTFPLLGLIFSWIALSGIKRTGNEEGKGLAMAGMIISSVLMAMGCLWIMGAMMCVGAASRF